MALNDDIDNVISGLPTFISGKTVQDGLPPAPRPMTEAEGLAIATVRLVKRYAAQKSVSEVDLLSAVYLRLQNRIAALQQAQAQAEAQVVATNKTAVAAAMAATTIPE